MDSYKFLGTTIANTLKWDTNAETIAKRKAQQRMFFLRHCAVSGSASIHNQNMPEGIVKTASKITGSKLPSMESIYTTRTLRKATTIIS